MIVEDEDVIYLPPMLADNFRGNKSVLIRPWRRSEGLQSRFNFDDIICCKPGMLQPVTKIDLQFITSVAPRPSTVKTAAAACNLTSADLLTHFTNNPEVVQIGQTLQVTINGSLYLLRVIRLEYLRDTSMLRKLLDIADESDVVPQRVEVSELTFNEHPGYLLH